MSPLNLGIRMQQYSETTNLSLVLESLIKIGSEGIELLIYCNYSTWRKKYIHLFRNFLISPYASKTYRYF